MLKNFASQLPSELGTGVFCISEIYNDEKKLQKAYEDTSAMVRTGYFCEKSCVIANPVSAEKDTRRMNTQALASAIQHAQAEEARKLLNDWKQGLVISKDKQLALAKIRECSRETALCAAKLEMNTENLWQHYYENENFAARYDCLIRGVLTVCEYAKKKAGVVSRMCLYVEEHYGDRDLSLEGMADMLQLNSSYLSRTSVWNDNCEYDSLMDKDCRCNFDGKGGTIGQLKPLMSTLMCKIGAEAVQEHDANARPYMVCRSGSAGIQHYAQTWCGDNATSWRTLQFNIPMILSMGLSGQPNDGADIGGFAGPAPEEELFIRWVQHGIFQPRFSIHSASSDNTVTEPWMYSKSTDLIREAIKLRYRFTPYLYSAEYEASCSGTPIMRPLVYEFQEDPNVYEESFTFLFGRDILVANVLEPGAVARKVYLPAGTRWFDWNDSMRCYEGGQTIEVPVTLASIPMFLREGAVVAMADNELHTMEGDQVKKLHLVVAPKDGVMSTLYDDDGISNDYKQGVYCKTTITMAAGERVILHFAQKGSYPDPVETIRMEMIAKEKSPYWVMIADKKLPHYLNRAKFKTAPEGWYYSQSRRVVEIKYANPGPDYTLVVSFEQFDLIGM